MTPLSASDALNQYFLEARSKLLDLAAIFDRIDRGTGPKSDDIKRLQLHQALTILNEPTLGRAERVQQLFSLPYDPKWPIPQPK
jgi:hypothetical protein